MAGRATNNAGQMPQMPKRKWWQHLPFLNQSYNDKLAKYQNDYNLWFWNKENLYNSPAMQKARWEEAGLSTNLMYGQGTPGNAESGKPAERPEEQSTGIEQMSGILSRMMDTKMKLAQVRSVEADTGIKQVQRMLLKNELNTKDVMELPGSKMFNRSMLTPRQTKYLAEMERALSQAESAKQQAEITKKINNWFVATMISQMATGGLSTIARFAGALK